PGLVVDPFHRGTGLAGIKVVEDLRLPTVVCLEKRTEIQTQLAALTAKFPQPARGRDSVARCIKDLLEPETNLVQRPQRRDLLKEGLQRLLLLGTQTLGIAAEGPHLGPKGCSLVLGQLRLVLSSDITPARKFRMLLHTNPTRERGECLGTRAGASEDM